MRDPAEPDWASRFPRRLSSKAGCLGLLVGIIAVGVGVWIYAHHSATAKYAAAEQQVRDRGEPLTLEELDAAYVVPPGREDVTPLLLSALKAVNSPELKALARSLPIVGSGNDPPLPPAPWDQLADAEAFLNGQTETLVLLQSLAGRAVGTRFPGNLALGPTRELSQLRDLARLLALDCQVQLHRGRPDAAIASLRGLQSLTAAVDGEPTLLSQLIRLALTRMIYEQTALAVRSGVLRDEHLLALQQLVQPAEDPADNELRGLRTALIGERALIHAELRNPSLSVPVPFPTVRLANVTLALEWSRRLIEGCDQGLDSLRHVTQELEAERVALSGTRWSGMRYYSLLMLLPAYQASVDAVTRTIAHRRVVDTLLAAERFRRRAGRWPNALEELVPEFLPRVPQDPFADQPLRLSSVDGELRIYSVGENAQDDGGMLQSRRPLDVGLAVPLESTPGVPDSTPDHQSPP